MVSINVTVGADDQARLKQLLGAGEVDRVLKLILTAGAHEALGYGTGKAVFSTMAELRMYRVFCLLEAGMTLDESEDLIATLFKLSPSGARRVVSSTLARYAYELSDEADKALRSRLETATWHKESKRWEVRLPAGFTRDRALDLCRKSEQPNPLADRGAIWRFAHETFNWLRDQVGLPPEAKPT